MITFLEYKKIPIFYQYQYFKPIGGDERVRTSAPLSGPNCLANSPLHRLGNSPYRRFYMERHNHYNKRED